MQSDPDIKKAINNQTEEAAVKSGGFLRAAMEVILRLFRSVIQIFIRLYETGRALTDRMKAGIAVIILAGSCAVIFYETGGLRMLRPDGSNAATRISGTAVSAGFADAVKDGACSVLRDGVSADSDSAEKVLKTALDRETAALRRSYRAILDTGQGASYQPESELEQKIWAEVRAERKEELSRDPFLLLVNKWNYLPEDYSADPVTLPNGQMIGSECYEPLMDMLKDCAEAGGTPIVCSGYRAHSKQVDLFSAQINRWLYAGYGQKEAEALAATAVAIPGTSEHELGLAADIYSSENMDLDESQIYTFTQQWLMNNCWRYGFVLRYPQDKSEITGIIFEPWHYRYVGLEHARKIHAAGICLEEYLDQAEHSDGSGASSDTEVSSEVEEAGDTEMSSDPEEADDTEESEERMELDLN